jgi:hypothetical protein
MVYVAALNLASRRTKVLTVTSAMTNARALMAKNINGFISTWLVNPSSQRRTKKYASGHASTLAHNIGTANCHRSMRRMSTLIPPNAFLMPISFVRSSAQRADSPRRGGKCASPHVYWSLVETKRGVQSRRSSSRLDPRWRCREARPPRRAYPAG